MENIDFSLGKDFKPKVKHKVVWMFYAAFGFFFAVGCFMLYFVGDDALAAVISMWALIFLMTFLIWLQTSGKTIRYHIQPHGLYIKRSWLKRFYRFEDIAAIALLNEQETEAIAENKSDKAAEAINDADLLAAFQGQMEFGKLIQFSSVQFVGSQTHSGNKITSNSIHTSGNFILLSLKDGNNHLITPEQMEAFIEEIERQSNGILRPSKHKKHALISIA